MGAIESVGTHLARLLPKAHADTLLRLERGAQQQTFATRDVCTRGECFCLPSSCLMGTSWIVASRRPDRCTAR